MTAAIGEQRSIRADCVKKCRYCRIVNVWQIAGKYQPAAVRSFVHCGQNPCYRAQVLVAVNYLWIPAALRLVRLPEPEGEIDAGYWLSWAEDRQPSAMQEGLVEALGGALA